MANDDKASCDLLVIGAGPGGYVAAIRAAQLGLDVVCVERENLGGVCLNWGCIPTKALLRSAEVLELAHRAGEFGVKVTGVEADFPAMVQRSRGVAAKISKGVGFLFKKNKIRHVAGAAKLLGAGKVEISADGGTQVITAKDIIVATGARARSLPGLDLDGEHIIAYREAMTLAQRPASLIIVGAGAIGVEFASFYRALGTEVTIVEYLPRLVPNEDADVSAELLRAFKKRGMKILVGHKVAKAEVAGGKVRASIEPAAPALSTRGDDRSTKPAPGGEAIEITADKLLVAVGITGNVEGLGLEDIGVKVDRGRIVVDDRYETGVRGVHAIGDVTGRVALAHVASAEAVHVAELIAGRHPHPVPYHAVPGCTYCHPEIASVGLTEEKAKEAGLDIRVGKFPFGPLGKTVAAGEYPGFAKLIWDKGNGALIGAHLIGPAVTDLIAAPTLAKTTEVNAESFIDTIWAHPTFSEALKEAAEDAFGIAIHI
jgi:dihydrolipoamide dehydrogenase